MLEFNFTPFPVLTTQRLVLRQVTPNDANEILFFRSHPSMMEFIQVTPTTTIEASLAWIDRITTALQKNEGITWGITLKNEPGKIVGTLGFWRTMPEHHRAEIGYQLHPDLRGKGIMQEALAAIFEYGFKVLKLHSVEANIDPANKASIGLMEKNGFVREAYFKEDYYYDGKFYDSVIYSLLARNYPPR